MTAKSKRRATGGPARAEPDDISHRLLDWYDGHRRELPWRYAPGASADPYRVWLSEIMLQQTVVKAVIPYFRAFTERWPTVADLAAAPLEDVLSAWAGLGYYSRARNLHAAAIAVVRDHAGSFPRDEAMLRALPGVGPYTAAAIAAIGFGLKATPVDGNVERVVARLFAVHEPLPAAKPTLTTLARSLTPDQRAGDFAQAMMDLGATICTPRSPDCHACPLVASCHAHAEGIAATLPRKAAKAERPTRHGVAFVIRRTDGAVAVRRRPPTGLLGGMHEVPSTPWSEAPPGQNVVAASRPLDGAYHRLATTVVHVFTHFRLELAIELTTVAQCTALPPPHDWVAVTDIPTLALPTVMKKVLQAADGDTAARQRSLERRMARKGA